MQYAGSSEAASSSKCPYLTTQNTLIYPMHLLPPASHEFINLQTEAILFMGQESGRLPAAMTPEELRSKGPEFLIEQRDRLYDDPSFFDRYADRIEGSVPDQWLEDLRGFKQFVRDSFFVMKYYKKYTVLMGNEQLYGVLGPTQSIEAIIPKWALPCMVETILVPFRGQYVYDGLLATSNVSFGRGMSASLNNDFKRLKAINGIITSPEQGKKVGKLTIDPAMEAERELRYLMNSRKRWDEEYYRISELRNTYPQLEYIFFECASKLLAKRKKKDLREIGVTGRYYAVYFNSVLASAPTRKALMKELKEITFDGRVEDCAVFKI